MKSNPKPSLGCPGARGDDPFEPGELESLDSFDAGVARFLTGGSSSGSSSSSPARTIPPNQTISPKTIATASAARPSDRVLLRARGTSRSNSRGVGASIGWTRVEGAAGDNGRQELDGSCPDGVIDRRRGKSREERREGAVYMTEVLKRSIRRRGKAGASCLENGWPVFRLRSNAAFH